MWIHYYGAECHKRPCRCLFAPNGYTIIELLVVVLLLGIVASVAQPRFYDALTHYRLECAATRIQSDLNYAQRLARIKSRNVTVRFFTGDEEQNGVSYRIDEVASPASAQDSYDPDDQSTWYSVSMNEEPYRVRIHTAPESIQFDIFGQPSQEADIVVTLGGQQRTVHVQVDTGEVSIR